MKQVAAIVCAALLIVAVAQAQVGPTGTLWRGSSGPGTYTTTGPGGYSSGGAAPALPAPTGNFLVLEDNSSLLLLEDNVSNLCLEGGC